MAPVPLPKPDSDELKALLPNRVHQAIYKVLFGRQGRPPTMREVQDAVRHDYGPEFAEQVHFSKRLRELRDFFEIPPATGANGYTYRLAGVRPQAKAGTHISAKLRAEVLRDKRCEMCGRTPAEDGVRLHVDHKIPREWGGTTERDNLQALCSECNEGKKAYFATFDEYADKLRAAVAFPEPHKRIGELLKAFYPGEVRSDVIEMVASAQQFQEDWQKRLRELRVLGWDYATRREKDERGRVRVHYRLTKSEPWPSGNVRTEISRREKLRKQVVS